MQNLLVGPFSVGVHYDPLQQYNTNRALGEQGLFGGNSFSNAFRNALATGLPQALVPPVQTQTAP